MINPKDYLKNYEKVTISCQAIINGKKFSCGMVIEDIKNEQEFALKVDKLRSVLQRTIIKENGYYEDFEKQFAQKVDKTND